MTENLFAAVLADVQRGNVLAELSQELGGLIAAVKATGKKGTLRLKLTIKPDDNGETTTVDAEVEAKHPRPNRPKIKDSRLFAPRPP